MRLVRAGTVAALAVLIAGCSKTRAPEQPAQAANDCTRCHGYPPNPTGPFIVATTTFHPADAQDCHLCHPGTVEADNVTIVPGGLHMDGVVEAAGHASGYDNPAVHGPDALVALGGTKNCTVCHGTDFSGGSANVSCNDCHAGAGVDDWKTNCTFCHGTHTNGVTSATALAAPPQSVSGTGAQDATNRRVGAHQAHLAAGEFANAFPCASCHTPVPTDALNHFAGYGPTSSVVPVFGALAQTGVTGAAYAGNGGTCAVYCHGSGSEFAGGATKQSPAWTQTTIACGDCHGLPPASGPNYPGPDAHTYHVTTVGLDCSKCHAGYTGGANPSVNLATHVDGQKQVTITGSNGPKPIDGWDCNACHQEIGAPLMHPTDATFFAQHGSAALGSLSSCAACHGATFDGTSGVPSCNACHATNVTASAPDWKQNCSFCHGTRTASVTSATALAAPPQSVAGTGAQDNTNAKVGAHQAHLADGPVSKALACGSCHTVPAAGDLTHFTGWSSASFVSPVFSDLAKNGVATPSYAANGGACAVYCHGSGSQFPGNATATVSPAWTTTGTATCGSCHGVPPTSGPTFLPPNAHAYHLAAGATCGSCHPGYGGTDASNATVNLTLHVDGTKEVAGNGTPVTGWDCTTCHAAIGVPPASHPVPYPGHTTDALTFLGGGPGSCTDCHGTDYNGGLNGLAPSCNGCHATQVAASAPDWKTNCTFCHGTRTASVSSAAAAVAPPQPVAGQGGGAITNTRVGAHQAHVRPGQFGAAFPCETCHYQAVPATGQALAHFGGWTTASTVTPAFNPLAKSGAGSAAYTGGSCSVYCHGSGTAWPSGSVAANQLPAWTSTGLGCTACHASRPNTGAHQSIVDHVAPCGECHLNYVEGASVDPAYHVNGSRDVIFTNRALGTTVITDVATSGVTAIWNNCANCHQAGANGNYYAPPF